jgi:hypothetical protein
MVEEALHIEDAPIGVQVAGVTSDGRLYSGTVYVPEAFPYLLMKLHYLCRVSGSRSSCRCCAKSSAEIIPVPHLVPESAPAAADNRTT